MVRRRAPTGARALYARTRAQARPVSAFFDHGADAAKDDLDPELKMNPVVMARLEMEREKRGEGKRKQWAPGTVGPLAKLGFRISKRHPAAAGKNKEERNSLTGGPPGAKMFKEIDMMVKRTNEPDVEGGVPSSGASRGRGETTAV